MAFSPLFEEDRSFSAVTMETKLYSKFLLTHSEAENTEKSNRSWCTCLAALLHCPVHLYLLHPLHTYHFHISSYDTCLHQDTDTDTRAYIQHSHTHTEPAHSQHMHLFLVPSHPTIHTVSHSSSRALPFFSTLHHHNCLNSFPLSPTSVHLSARRYHGNWLTTDGLENVRIGMHDWQARARSEVHAQTHTYILCTFIIIQFWLGAKFKGGGGLI